MSETVKPGTSLSGTSIFTAIPARVLYVCTGIGVPLYVGAVWLGVPQTRLFPAGFFVLLTAVFTGIAAFQSNRTKTRAAAIRLATDLSEKKHRLEHFQQRLIDLSKHEAISGGDIKRLYHEICATISASLQISRVSIWLFDEPGATLERQFLFQAGGGIDDQRVEFRRESFPIYFDALLRKPYIRAEHAHTDPDTAAFAEPYLIPLSIFSLLDCPILINREPAGVICCEHQYEVKNWQTEEALFVQSLADLAAMAMQNGRIRSLLEQVQRQNTELQQHASRVGNINSELEKVVETRTSELGRQNRQLAEYAFINAHLLRAPLSRILALSQLLATEALTVKERELVEGLIASSLELDSVIRKIGAMLHNDGRITNEEFNALISGYNA